MCDPPGTPPVVGIAEAVVTAAEVGAPRADCPLSRATGTFLRAGDEGADRDPPVVTWILLL